MSEYINFGLLCFTAFFTIINPIGVMPVFMSMVANLNAREQARTARKASLFAFLTMVAFAFSGQLLFSFFGISANSFRIVGGIIFFQMGAEMLQARLSRTKINDDEVKEYVTDISITPLAIPMLCGPGAITNSIVMMEDAATVPKKAILIGVMALIMLITYIVLRASSTISRWLGETGNKIMLRLMGLIVMVIAVEFFLSGFRPIFTDIVKGIMQPQQ